jgi:hypothetical protein
MRFPWGGLGTSLKPAGFRAARVTFFGPFNDWPQRAIPHCAGTVLSFAPAIITRDNAAKPP